MNVNDVMCVGAEPVAMLDYIAVEHVDAATLEQIGVGLKEGAELAGIEIPGGSSPSPDHPRTALAERLRARRHRVGLVRPRRDRDRRPR